MSWAMLNNGEFNLSRRMKISGQLFSLPLAAQGEVQWVLEDLGGPQSRAGPDFNALNRSAVSSSGSSRFL